MIKGHLKYISGRANCFDCSPFNTTNDIVDESANRVCKRCSKPYKYLSATGTSVDFCKSCQTNQKRQKRKDMAIKYLGEKCQVCGYDKCIQALQFHHLDPDKKSFQLSGNMHKNFEVLKSELDKCILICANCHFELHAGLIDISKLSFIKNEEFLIKEKSNRIKLEEKICPACKNYYQPEKNSQIYCSVKCAKTSQQKSIRPSKEDLREMVNTYGYEYVGRLHNVTGNAVRKWLN